MAKVYGKIMPRTIAALRGKVDLYYHKKYGWIARAWPKYNNRNRSPAYEDSKNRMRQQTAVLASLTDADRAAWKETTVGADLTWKDAIVKRLLTRPTNEFTIIRLGATGVRRLDDLTCQFYCQKNPEDVGTSRDDWVDYRVHIYAPNRITVTVPNSPGFPYLAWTVEIPNVGGNISFAIFGNRRST